MIWDYEVNVKKVDVVMTVNGQVFTCVIIILLSIPQSLHVSSNNYASLSVCYNGSQLSCLSLDDNDLVYFYGLVRACANLHASL